MVHYHIRFKENGSTGGKDPRTFIHENAAKDAAFRKYRKTEEASTFRCSAHDCKELIQGSVA